MKKINKIISLFVLSAFIFNAVASDLALAQSNVSSDDSTLATPMSIDDIVSVTSQHKTRIKIALEILLKNPKSLYPADIQFLFRKPKPAPEGFSCVMCRMRGKFGSVRIYYAMYAKEKDVDGLYPVKIYTDAEYNAIAAGLSADLSIRVGGINQLRGTLAEKRILAIVQNNNPGLDAQYIEITPVPGKPGQFEAFRTYGLRMVLGRFDVDASTGAVTPRVGEAGGGILRKDGARNHAASRIMGKVSRADSKMAQGMEQIELAKAGMAERSLKTGRRTQPGKNPEDALKVIAKAKDMLLVTFTLDDYMKAYAKLALSLGFNTPISESAARTDLEALSKSKPEQGYLHSYKDKRPYLYQLTEKGRKATMLLAAENQSMADVLAMTPAQAKEILKASVGQEEEDALVTAVPDGEDTEEFAVIEKDDTGEEVTAVDEESETEVDVPVAAPASVMSLGENSRQEEAALDVMDLANATRDTETMLSSVACEAGLELTKDMFTDTRYKLLVMSEFFTNGELNEHKARYGDRFDLDTVSGQTAEQFVNNVLAKAVGIENRTVVLMPDDIRDSVQPARLTAAGIRFIMANKRELIEARTGKDANREKFQLDTYATMLLVRRIDATIKKDSAIYRALQFYLRSHFEWSEDLTADKYIMAVINNDISKLIKAVLSYRPITPYDAVKDYENIAKTLISA